MVPEKHALKCLKREPCFWSLLRLHQPLGGYQSAVLPIFGKINCPFKISSTIRIRKRGKKKNIKRIKLQSIYFTGTRDKTNSFIWRIFQRFQNLVCSTPLVATLTIKLPQAYFASLLYLDISGLTNGWPWRRSWPWTVSRGSGIRTPLLSMRKR